MRVSSCARRCQPLRSTGFAHQMERSRNGSCDLSMSFSSSRISLGFASGIGHRHCTVICNSLRISAAHGRYPPCVSRPLPAFAHNGQMASTLIVSRPPHWPPPAQPHTQAVAPWHAWIRLNRLSWAAARRSIASGRSFRALPRTKPRWSSSEKPASARPFWPRQFTTKALSVSRHSSLSTSASSVASRPNSRPHVEVPWRSIQQ